MSGYNLIKMAILILTTKKLDLGILLTEKKIHLYLFLKESRASENDLLRSLFPLSPRTEP